MKTNYSTYENEFATKEFISVCDSIVEHQVRKRQSLELECPYCKSLMIVGYGKRNGKQRYKCKDCERTFTENVFSITYHLHKPNLLRAYMQCMIDGKTIAATALSIGVSVVTAFNWRHKILAALRDGSFEKLSQIIELCDVQLQYSEKGSKKRVESKEKYKIPVSILVSMDRNERLLMRVTGRGTPTSKRLVNIVKNQVNNDAIICLNKNIKSENMFRKNGLRVYRIEQIAGKLIRNESKHLNNVLKTSWKFMVWLLRFQGVASKYLQNYLNWFVFEEQLKRSAEPLNLFLKRSIRSSNAWRRMKCIQAHSMLAK